jgi:hypothetical protein
VQHGLFQVNFAYGSHYRSSPERMASALIGNIAGKEPIGQDVTAAKEIHVVIDKA